MASVNVVITEVPVSKPKLRPLSSQVDRPTCWGQPVTVRCGCEQGTGVRYTWYKSTQLEDTLLHDSADIHLQCGTLDKDSDYYCTAHNDISSDRSDILSVQVLMPAESSCIYVINMQGQPIYDCVDRMSTTLASTSPPLTTWQATLKIHSDTINQSSRINQTDQHLFLSRSWTGLPLWQQSTLILHLWLDISLTSLLRLAGRNHHGCNFLPSSELPRPHHYYSSVGVLSTTFN
ncbi:hypothetical protein D5F01_LYC07885 [Larimichthys crocea]|uniref:Ig-like domain-containing protein n=1 Tax=Larimichthys crocea TaxID=215358 RepID=A0A6G0INF6_LARCR|nr:hypothetical protein D5F01_LYC07885 [Larimichthys crocea]